MLSFVKDLGSDNLQLIRHLDQNVDSFKRQFRSLELVVIWVDGDRTQLKNWAKENKIENIALAVIDSKDSTMKPWRINSKVRNTTVLTMPCLPKQVFINFNPMHHADLESGMQEHFARYLR